MRRRTEPIDDCTNINISLTWTRIFLLLGFAILLRCNPKIPSIKIVPSPIMESELRDSDESAIMPPETIEGIEEMSLDNYVDTSIETQIGTSTEAPTVMEATPYATPCIASRTRSHDRKEPSISAPQHIIMELVDEIMQI